MRVFLFFFCGCVAGWLSAGAAEDADGGRAGGGSGGSDPLHLPLDAALDRVRELNPRVLLERESVRRALERSYQRRAALLPQVTLRAEQRRTQLASGFSGGGLAAPPFSRFVSRVEGTLTIVDSQQYADYKIAQLEHTIAKTDFRVALQDILEETASLYFTQLRDLRQVAIIRGNLERERALLELARKQFEAGTAIRIDVTRAEVRMATQKRALMEARTNVADSMLQLKTLLDIGMDRDVTLDRSIIRDINPPETLWQYGGRASLAEQRPELESREQSLERARLARKAAGWQRLPSIELFGDWGYDSVEIFDGRESEAWSVGIRASVPIFEGFRIAAEKREADAAVRQSQYALRDTRNRVERELRFARIDMESRHEQIAIARDEVRLGEAEVKQARERYREGLADNRELIDAQQRLADAEDSLLRAVYLYGLSRLSFARSIGSVGRVLD